MRSPVSLFSPCLLALFVAGNAWAQPAPPDSVAPQQVIPRLNAYASLATVLNLSRGAVRIVAIVSPGSETADRGLDVIDRVLAANSSRRLRAYVLLSKASESDTEIRAVLAASRHREPRIVYLWDPDQIAGNAFRSVVGLESGPVHDVYFLFDTAATFRASPPKPDLWMSLNSAIDGPPLDADSLQAEAGRLVRRVERSASSRAMDGD